MRHAWRCPSVSLGDIDETHEHRKWSSRYEKYFFWCAGMRRLIVRECGIGTDGPALSNTSGHANSAVRRWRAPRYADAHCERANARLAWPTDTDRKYNGRIRCHRRWPRCSGRAGWLYCQCRKLADSRREWGDVHAAVRSSARLRAGRSAVQQPVCGCGAKWLTGEHFARSDCPPQSKPGEAHPGYCRARLGTACQWNLLPKGDRNRSTICPVSQWLLRRYERPGRWTH